MATLADPTASRAVLVGVPEYRSLPPLPAVGENVSALRRLLADPAVWGLPTENILVPDLSGPDPLDAVLGGLRSAAREATDTLLVYYAGHGLTNPLTGELILALPGAEDLDRYWRVLLFDQIRRGLTDPTLAATRRVVVLDCCYSALALAGDMGPAPDHTDVAELTEVNGAFVLTACAESETAKAPPGARYTAFTGELITALEDGVADGPELLDLHTLYRHLATVLAGKRWPVPQQRSRNSIGDLALARNRAWSAPAAAPVEGNDAGRGGPVRRSLAVPATERARLLQRVGNFPGAAAALREAAVDQEPEALRQHIRQLRRANRHSEAAALWRLTEGV
ncbi:Caspase domain protein [Micromonospora sp. MW-13]|uniref:caspase family protein n=1 Tax=Micromonospora sp. MW-13 TaxID=2094022 RepID=UPI000E445C3F|nr:caspase family protein [Micromonospora sp. MW-13]RGC66476.1 Caspase domain protein [Micromonospora sp. MW-13]